MVGSILKIYNITITFISDSEKDEKERTYYVQNPRVVVFAVLYFLLIILRSYVNTKIKTFLDLKYISHRFLMITYGIAGTFICFITGIITTNVACSATQAMLVVLRKIINFIMIIGMYIMAQVKIWLLD